MAFFGRGPGVMDVIRCDLDDYLIWKWEPVGNDSKSKERANAIRWGSSLRVKEGSVAAFVYTQNDGMAQDFFEGPVDLIVDTTNFPVLSTLIGKLYSGSSPFQAEVYFINLANLIQIKFGVPYFDVFDPRFIDFGIPTAVRGTVNFHISDYRKFIKLHKLTNFSMAQFELQVRDAIVRYVKQIVINAPDNYGIPIVQMERRISEISDIIKTELMPALNNDFGVEITRVDLSAIDMDKNSAGYKKLASITQNKAVTFVQSAQVISTAASAQKMGQKSILQTRREASHQESKGIDLGEVGKQISGTIGNLFSGLFKPTQQTTPPPIPVVEYFVAINGQQAGPFSTDKLIEMRRQGSFTSESLVWKSGMEAWAKAGDVPELALVFDTSENNPPPIPV